MTRRFVPLIPTNTVPGQSVGLTVPMQPVGAVATVTECPPPTECPECPECPPVPPQKIGLFWELYPFRVSSEYHGHSNVAATDIECDIGYVSGYGDPLIWIAKIYVPAGETIDYIGDPVDEQIYVYDWQPDAGYTGSFSFNVFEDSVDPADPESGLPMSDNVVVMALGEYSDATRGTLTFTMRISGVDYTITAWINTADGYVGTY